VLLEMALRLELLAGRRRVPLEEDLDAPRDEGHAEQRLSERVVELAGEVSALIAGRQICRLPTEVPDEPLVLPHVTDRAMGTDESALVDAAGDPDLDRDRIPALTRHRDPERIDVPRVSLDRLPRLLGLRHDVRLGERVEWLPDDLVRRRARQLGDPGAQDGDRPRGA